MNYYRILGGLSAPPKPDLWICPLLKVMQGPLEPNESLEDVGASVADVQCNYLHATLNKGFENPI
jgi:hypothetical protein